MSSHTLLYIGDRKIAAVKVMRACTGAPLKEALNAVNNPLGFIVSQVQAQEIISTYAMLVPNPKLVNRISDWMMWTHNDAQPTDLRSINKGAV